MRFKGPRTDMNILLGPLLEVIFIIIDLYMWVVVIGVVLSWLVSFNVVNTSNRFVFMVGDLIHRLTEPLLGRIRAMLPNFGGLDLSPMVLIIGLFFLQRVVGNLIRTVA